ncbi:TPA: PTS transporter subunit EIIC, partial [Clostridioides difficile]|nr:PTS transporter subunit EIIC [Clostridioides difficile]
MKEKLLGGLETFAKAMVQPLMYLSSAGILMVVGVLLTNDMLLGVLPFLKWEPIQIFGSLIYNCIMAIINNLAVIFAIGIPAALAKKEKHKAALIGFMSYIIYLTASNTMLTSLGQLAKESKMLGLIGTGQATILGIQVVDTSVFGGIILGCIAGY